MHQYRDEVLLFKVDAYLGLQAAHLGCKMTAGLFSFLGLQPSLLQLTTQTFSFRPQLLVLLLQLLQILKLFLQLLVLLLLGIIMGLGSLHLCGQTGCVWQSLEINGQEEGQGRTAPGPLPGACNAQLPAPSGSAGPAAHSVGSGGAGPPAGFHLPGPGKPEKSIKTSKL